MLEPRLRRRLVVVLVETSIVGATNDSEFTGVEELELFLAFTSVYGLGLMEDVPRQGWKLSVTRTVCLVNLQEEEFTRFCSSARHRPVWNQFRDSCRNQLETD